MLLWSLITGSTIVADAANSGDAHNLVLGWANLRWVNLSNGRNLVTNVMRDCALQSKVHPVVFSNSGMGLSSEVINTDPGPDKALRVFFLPSESIESNIVLSFFG
jgi:hypothetical protein